MGYSSLSAEELTPNKLVKGPEDQITYDLGQALAMVEISKEKLLDSVRIGNEAESALANIYYTHKRDPEESMPKDHPAYNVLKKATGDLISSKSRVFKEKSVLDNIAKAIKNAQNLVRRKPFKPGRGGFKYRQGTYY
jgi:hypothetical protein